MKIHPRTPSLVMAVVLILCGLPAAPCHAAQVRPVNLAQMTERADRVFRGRCIEVRREMDPTLGHPVTLVSLEVLRAIKGNPGSTVTIKLLGDGSLATGTRAGSPPFRAGEEVVLFLYGDSPLGLSSPVGFGQGKFSIFKDKLGRERAMNSSGNRQLLQGLSDASAARLGGVVAGVSEKDLAPDRLLDWAASLIEPGAGR